MAKHQRNTTDVRCQQRHKSMSRLDCRLSFSAELMRDRKIISLDLIEEKTVK